MTDWQAVRKIADAYGKKRDADVLFYNGPIHRGWADRFVRVVRLRKRRKNVFRVLVTSGGDAHAAYKMARTLQHSYDNFLLSSFRAGVRAGATLLAIGAHSLGDLGEIGPIDVQRAKQDDLWESSSGLTEDAAIAALENAAWMMFQRFVVEIKGISAGRITFKTAADVASNLVSGAFSPIFAQIDPLKIGENSRAMKIASPTYSWWAEFIG